MLSLQHVKELIVSFSCCQLQVRTMPASHVTSKPCSDRCSIRAVWTGIRLLSCVYPHMFSEVILVIEVLGAMVTGEAERRAHLRESERYINLAITTFLWCTSKTKCVNNWIYYCWRIVLQFLLFIHNCFRIQIACFHLLMWMIGGMKYFTQRYFEFSWHGSFEVGHIIKGLKHKKNKSWLY